MKLRTRNNADVGLMSVVAAMLGAAPRVANGAKTNFNLAPSAPKKKARALRKTNHKSRMRLRRVSKSKHSRRQNAKGIGGSQ